MTRLLNYFREDPSRVTQRMSITSKDCQCSFGLAARAKRIFDPSIPVRTYTKKKVRRPRRGKRLDPPTFSAPEPIAEEVSAIVEDQTMTVDDKRNFLRKMAENPEVRDEAKISAIRTLHMIDESAGKSRELGPGKPLTFEDTVHRLYLLITACGPDVAREAVRLAKKEWEIAGSLKAPKAPEPAATL